MQYQYKEPIAGAYFSLSASEAYFEQRYFGNLPLAVYNILWNRGDLKTIEIDGTLIQFPANSFIALNYHHSFKLKDSELVVIWQFNREFYCIVHNDEEVSCTGILFYNMRETHAILADEKQLRLFGLLVEIFIDEFGTQDNIQGEMLRMLLKRLIIKLTRLVKLQSVMGELGSSDLSLVRSFHMLVEGNFKTHHQVKDYAALMNKSPKTLSNLFSKYKEMNPLQVIQERLFLESKRLILYTDHTSSEISNELGFTEPAHFSRFFKAMSGKTVTEFRNKAIGDSR